MHVHPVLIPGLHFERGHFRHTASFDYAAHTLSAVEGYAPLRSGCRPQTKTPRRAVAQSHGDKPANESADVFQCPAVSASLPPCVNERGSNDQLACVRHGESRNSMMLVKCFRKTA
jgi:hypothetical protein